jgi:hypothetical protein
VHRKVPARFGGRLRGKGPAPHSADTKPRRATHPVNTFKESIIYIRIADENDPVTRLARGLLTMNDYIHEDPGRLETLANIAAFATARMGQGELAKTLATLHQPAQSDQLGANGSADAGP